MSDKPINVLVTVCHCGVIMSGSHCENGKVSDFAKKSILTALANDWGIEIRNSPVWIGEECKCPK